MGERAQSILDELRSLLGPGHVLTGAAVEGYRLGARAPGVAVRPGDEDGVSRVLAAANGAGLGVVPWGGGLHQAVGGRPRAYDVALDLTRLDRIVGHEPGDLTATVQAGVRLGDLEAALRRAGQFVPLDPPRTEGATLGGVLAANLAGPLRCRYGTARDLVLGVRVAHADGTVTRAGARVVKNATAYDLTKLYLGSHGTLGVILEATLRLFPRLETEGAWWVATRDLAPAQALADRILGSHLTPSRLELLDREAAANVALPRHTPGALVSFAGVREAVAAQEQVLRRLAGEAGGEVHALHGPWAFTRLADFPWPAPAGTEGLAARWRASVLPADAGKAMQAVVAASAGSARTAAAATAAHGVLRGWALAGTPEGLERALRASREAAERLGGFLVVLDAPEVVRERLDVWGAPPDGLEVMRGLKQAFDPRGTLNPGRFVGGI